VGTLRVLRAPAARAVRARGAGLLDALLHGRGWIGLVGVLLVGIVFFNVALLELNRGIAHTAERAAVLERANSRLRLSVARLGSTERIQRVAGQRGLVMPAPGDVHYLRLHPRADGRLAARRAGPPGEGVQAALPQPAPAPAPAPTPAAGTAQPAAPAAPAPTATTPIAPPTAAATPPGQG
jgi:cell division protein FtsL